MALVKTQVPRLPPAGGSSRDMASAVNNLFAGRCGWVGEVTLTDNADTTEVSDTRVASNGIVLLMPLTANAAAGLATSYIAEADLVAGGFTISHTNNAQTDRTFRYGVFS